MKIMLAHDSSRRTEDVQISEDVTFSTMLLSTKTEKGLKDAGFYKPSPIQLNGIPLGKCGFDLLLEAKSGTGKTAVFTVIALEKIDLKKSLQVVILAPTREIASQICDVIKVIGSQYVGLGVEVVMGGLPVEEDIAKFKCKRKVHIVVGSPGRLRNLIQNGHIDTSAARLLVLDEADKLMEKSFQADINYIFSYLPAEKQVIMSSATYPESSKTFINLYVKNAQYVCPDSTNILIGIEQKVAHVMNNSNIVRQTKLRYEELIKILSAKQFKQCLIFCNYQARVADLHKMLTKDKWPSEQLYGKQEQVDRLEALKTLQEYKCRILVATDLVARGIDASNIDLVINFEPPYDWQTYLHRIGRAGRFGSYGIAITILSTGKEEIHFKKSLRIMKNSLNICDMWTNLKYNIGESDQENIELSPTIENISKLNLSTEQNRDENNSFTSEECLKTKDKPIIGIENKLNFNPEELLHNVWDEISTTVDSDFQNVDSLKETIDKNLNVHTFSDLLQSYENDTCNENQNEAYSTLKCENVSAEDCTTYLKFSNISLESAFEKPQDWMRQLKTYIIPNDDNKIDDTNSSEKYDSTEAPKINGLGINNENEDTNTVDLNQYTASHKEMVLMGLPTAFGSSRDIKRNKKHSFSMHKEQKIHSNLCKESRDICENYNEAKIQDNETLKIYKQMNDNNIYKGKHQKVPIKKVQNHRIDIENADDEKYYHSDYHQKSKYQSKSLHYNYINWYNQLKMRTKQIEMALYIEELSKM